MVTLAAPAAFAQDTSTTAAPMSSGSAGMVMEPSVHQVFFGLGSSELDGDALAAVTAAANDFRRTGTASVQLTGHTDTTGTPQINQEVAQRRTDAVARELERLGVPAGSITQVNVGENDLLVPTGNNVAEPENRRVEIRIEQPAAPAMADMAAPAAATAYAAPEPVEEVRRARFSLGGYYGLNLLDEGHNDGRDRGTSHLAGLNLSFDYLLTDWLNLSLEQAGFYNFGTDDNGLGGRTAAGLDYVFAEDSGFGLGNFLPYVGANIGYIYGSGIDDDFFAGPEVGINVGIFNAKIAYDIPFDRDVSEGIVSTTIGLGITF